MRVLFLADTHLGFDMPSRPRIERRRRGEDFFAAFRAALDPARRGEVDLVVHGGDLLFRSRVRASLVQRALEPLLALADRLPVVLVLGNHERSTLPFPLLAAHPSLHVVDRPRVLDLETAAGPIRVVALPHDRRGARETVPRILRTLDWRGGNADLRLLCLHEAVEGARVGPGDFVFRPSRPDTVRGRDLPAGFAAVLAGHIHRHQVLTTDLTGRPLAAPVVFAGSTERTGAAEADETKGFVILDLEPGCEGGSVRDLAFVPLTTRPMVVLRLDGAAPVAGTRRELRRAIRDLPADAVLLVRFVGGSGPPLSAAEIRGLAPPTMTVEVSWREVARRGSR